MRRYLRSRVATKATPRPSTKSPANSRTKRRTNTLLGLQLEVREGARHRVRLVEGDFFPGVEVGEELAHQEVVHLVARLVSDERADDRTADEVEVADRVERLVLDEFVLHAQPLDVEHAEI